MIERLPLDIFDDKPAEPEPPPAPPATTLEAPPTPEDGSTAAPESAVFMVSCQWCGAMIDNELEKCPSCGGTHHKLAAPEDDTDELTCQWCLATVAPGVERCPECNARVVAPNQYTSRLPEFQPFARPVQPAQTWQMLSAMMSNGLDFRMGGLIGLALFLLDD